MTNFWKDKLLKYKTQYHIKKNVSQFIFNLAAALGPESVLTNLTHGRSSRPPSLS